MSTLRIERVSNGFLITKNATDLRIYQFSEKDDYEEREKKAALNLARDVIDFFGLSPNYYDWEIQIEAVKRK